jgi:predicted short-subunit dehydrogenase-like oxidoreductase (DUF2520 family)
VATTFGVLLQRAGHRVILATGREPSRLRVERHLPGAPFVPWADPAAISEALQEADLVLIGVPDDAIAAICEAVVGGFRAGQTVAHLSGSVSLQVLASAKERGADVLSLHPLQSFPDVETGLAKLPGSGVAVTGSSDAVEVFGERVVRSMGARPFRLADPAKPLYHAAAVFCSNYLVTVEAIAERLLTAAGVADPLALMEPLARTAFDRTFELGPAAALTGPAVRGDAGTIERNLLALAANAPEAVEPYRALARVAAGLAREAGRLDEDGERRVTRALEREATKEEGTAWT